MNHPHFTMFSIIGGALVIAVALSLFDYAYHTSHSVVQSDMTVQDLSDLCEAEGGVLHTPTDSYWYCDVAEDLSSQ